MEEEINVVHVEGLFEVARLGEIPVPVTVDVRQAGLLLFPDGRISLARGQRAVVDDQGLLRDVAFALAH